MPETAFSLRLKQFNLDIGTAKAGDINVPANEEVVLDASSAKFKSALKHLQLNTLDDVKNWFGNPDTAIVKPTVGVKTIASPRSIAPSRTIASTLLPSAIFPVRSTYSGPESQNLRLLAGAYVYGHSASVDAKQLPALNAWIEGLKVRVPVFVFNDINVAKGATLSINVNGLFCNYITVEYTGRIKLRGGSRTVIHATGFTGKGPRIVRPAPVHPGGVVRPRA